MIDTNILKLPCGSTAHFDIDSGIGFRCQNCMQVVGSVGQPRICKDISHQYDVLERLGGKGWDYVKGRER